MRLTEKQFLALNAAIVTIDELIRNPDASVLERGGLREAQERLVAVSLMPVEETQETA